MTFFGSVAALSAALTLGAPTVHADEPAIGSGCDSGQLNLTTKSSAGDGLRCLADNNRGYIWQRDNGTTQSRDDAERITRDACQKLPRGARVCDSWVNRIPG